MQFPVCASCTLSIKHVNDRLYLDIATRISTEYVYKRTYTLYTMNTIYDVFEMTGNTQRSPRVLIRFSLYIC